MSADRDDDCTIGFVGLGEAGSAIAESLARANGVRISAFDTRPDLRARTSDTGVTMVDSLAELAENCTVLVALTTASSVVKVANEIASLLSPDHVYADWNSASPETKTRAAAAVRSSGAQFVDGAIMDAVPALGHRVPVLISGPGCPTLLGRTAGLGLNLEMVGDVPGQAAAVKMLRSLLVKGLEALVLECVISAEHYGVTNRVMESMSGKPDTSNWDVAARYMLERIFDHGSRRAAELQEVASTITAAGIDPLLARAAGLRLRQFADDQAAQRSINEASMPQDPIRAAARIAKLGHPID